MENVTYGIGILTSKERFATFEKIIALQRIECKSPDGRPIRPTRFSERPDWLRILQDWDKAGLDVAVVDDEAFPDKDAMVAGLGYFLSLPRPKEGHLRPIFVGGTQRQATDDVYVKLASSGLYDLVIPGRDVQPSDKLCQLIVYPAKRADVADLVKAAPLFDLRAAPQPADAPLTAREEARVGAREKSVIAVAGIMPRSGATNCSIVLARTLVMLGQTPALIVDKRTGNGFQKGYGSAVSPDGKSFRVNGVDIFPEMAPAQISRRYSHVVLDVGYLSWGLRVASAEEQNKVIEFNKADLQVVYLPCGSPADFDYLTRFFESQTKAELERYAIGVWGATDELFAMIRAKFREKAPNVFMWNVDVYRWPLQLGTLSPDMVEVLRPVLPRGVADRALAAAGGAAAGGANAANAAGGTVGAAAGASAGAGSAGSCTTGAGEGGRTIQ